MKLLALLVALGLILLAVVLVVWIDRRATARRTRLAELASKWHLAVSTLSAIDAEIVVQAQAGVADLLPLRNILNEYDTLTLKETP